MHNDTEAHRRRRRRAITVIGLGIAMVGALAAPALAHPSFPNVGPEFANPSGGTGVGTQTPPYAPGSSQTLKLRMPFERDGVIFQGAVNTTVDVKVTVPAGWTNPVCGAASTSVGSSQVGTVVPGWSCALETADGHDVLHWSGPQVSPTQTAADSAQFFTFQATVPSPANQTSYGAFGGPEGFFAVQKYADGDTSIWKCPNDPRPATDVATGLVRTVAGTSPPPPPPAPGPPPVVRASDGKIVFQSARDGNNEIYLMNADGTGLTRLTNHPADDLTPTFSLDGTQIAFTTDRTGNREINVTNTDGTSGALNLTNNPAVDDLAKWGTIPDPILACRPGAPVPAGYRVITGTPGDDVLIGRFGRNIIYALAGDDVIIGGRGADIICAGLGNDTVHSWLGGDQLSGYYGNDRLLGGAGNDRLSGGAGTDLLHGGAGRDTGIDVDPDTTRVSIEGTD